ncbi:DUF4411 family protein [Cyclobacterium sediminis]
MKAYVVDSNFFIQAHRATYPLDVAKSFWLKVNELAQSGTIISIDKVKQELFNKNDNLEDWCKGNLPDGFFKDSSTALSEYSKISAWAISKSDHYLPNAINEFLDVYEADAFLVAYVLEDVQSRVLVTHEVSDPNRKNKIKMPEPCKHFGVSYRNTIEMFRELGITF